MAVAVVVVHERARLRTVLTNPIAASARGRILGRAWFLSAKDGLCGVSYSLIVVFVPQAEIRDLSMSLIDVSPAACERGMRAV